MATNMDKALYEAPQGLDQLGEAEEPIEIEIEDPESVRIKAGDVEIEIEPTDEDDEFEVSSTTTRSLVSAFSKYTSNRVSNRIVLNRFINLIA